MYQVIPKLADEVSSILANISTVLCNELLVDLMLQRRVNGDRQIAIGATSTSNGEYLVHDHGRGTNTPDDAMADSKESDTILLNSLYDKAQVNLYNLDEIMVSSLDITWTKNIDAERFSKLWRIDLDSAKKP